MGVAMMRLLAFLSVLLMPGIAIASECPTRTEALDRLASKYGEHPIWQGVNTAGVLIDLTVSQDGGTWTLVVTLPDKTTCLITSGDGWRKVKPPDGPET